MAFIILILPIQEQQVHLIPVPQLLSHSECQPTRPGAKRDPLSHSFPPWAKWNRRIPAAFAPRTTRGYYGHLQGSHHFGYQRSPRFLPTLTSVGKAIPANILLHSKGSNQSKATYRMGENTCKPIFGDFPDGSVGKEYICNAGDTGDEGSLLGSGRSPGDGNGNPLQYYCLENSTDRGAWWL